MNAQISEYMGSLGFDTLKFAKRAEKVGFTPEQAEFQAEEIARVLGEHLATKQDILDLKTDLKKVQFNLKSLENKMTIKVGSMLVVAIGVLTTLIKLS